MSHAFETSQLNGSTNLAQIIHQQGRLIFANMSAARLFGFEKIADFVDFSHRTNLFVFKVPTKRQKRKRQLTFHLPDGQKLRTTLCEETLAWQGQSAAHVTLTPITSKKQSCSTKLRDPLTKTLTPETKEKNDVHASTYAAFDVSRQGSGAFVKICRPFDIASACVRLVDEMAPLADARGVKLSLEISPQALKIFEGDASLVLRTATCMVLHAINHIQNGTVKIKLLVNEVGSNVRLDVRDSGNAYTDLESASLINALPQSDNGEEGCKNPQALNLPMAQCIATFLGGTLELKVDHIAGGLIRLDLPMAIAHGEVRNQSFRKDPYLPINILVADNDPTNQQVIKVILQTLGHTPTMVSNGAQCFDALAHGQFDILILNLVMPDLDGHAVARQIRAAEMTSGTNKTPIPIVAISADTCPRILDQTDGDGISDFLTRPLHVPQILGVLGPIIEAIRGRTHKLSNALIRDVA